MLPLRCQGHQAARDDTCHHRYAHLRVITHLDSISSLITFPIYIYHSLWFLPQALLFLCHVCVLLMFLVLYYLTFILFKHSLPELASRLSAHIVTVIHSQVNF